MVAFNKIEIFVEDLAEGVHDLDTDTLTAGLTTNAEMPVTTDNLIADITPINYSNLTPDPADITLTSSAHTTGTYKIILQDRVQTAGGAVATFRGVFIYNRTTAVKVDPLIAWYDHGSDVTLASGETFTFDFDGSGGFFTIA